MYSGKLRNTVFLVAVLMILTGFASAAWTLTNVNSPYDQMKVSNNTQTVKVVKLTDGSGNPVDKAMLDSDPAQLTYAYNASTGPHVQMKWLRSGYYFARFKTNSSNGSYIEYKLDSSQSGYPTKTRQQQMTFGNISVNFEQATNNGKVIDLSNRQKFGRHFTLNVSVMDDWNDVPEDQATVSAYFTNMTSMGSKVQYSELGQKNGRYYTQSMTIPDNSNSSYVLWINASRSSASYNNAFGSTAVIVRTLPQVKGEIQRLNASSGCDQVSMPTECEWDTKLDTAYNITSSDANNVNVSLQLKNRDTGNWEYYSNESLTKSNGLWKGSLTMPDFNTSKYGKNIRLKYNATNNLRQDVDYYGIGYRSYRTRFTSDSVTSPGGYNLKIGFNKYFTPTPLNGSRMNATVNVTKPSGEELTHFNLAGMTYHDSNGLFSRKISIPFNNETGIYNVEVNSTDKWGVRKIDNYNFKVKDVTKTFNLTDDSKSMDIDREGMYHLNVSVKNLVGSQNTFKISPSGFGDNIKVSTGDNNQFTLDANQEDNVTLDINVSSVEDRSGEVKIMDPDANYNSTVTLDISAPSCTYRNETVCVSTDKSLSVSSDSRGYISRILTVRYLGPKQASSDFDVSFDGNISDVITADPSTFTLNSTKKKQSMLFNYTVQKPGYFNGTATVSNGNGTEFAVSLDSGVTATSSSIDIPGSVDLGAMPSGKTASKEIDVKNTGDVKINSLRFSSDTYSVSMTVDGTVQESISIEPGNTKTVTLNFDSVSEESGDVVAAVETDFETYTKTVSVSATLVPDYVQKASTLQRRVISLDSKISSSSPEQTTVDQLQTTISDIKTAYRQGNYDQAKKLYDSAQQDVNRLENQVSSTTGNNTTGGNERPGTGTDTTGTTGDQNGGGGSGFLIIAVILVVLLLIGFVAYTSLIPEEGDPLYDVLGK
ncbi:MAG: hypothetical protein ABEJ99_02225 [Candidatus Nanohaloarchaea archaeon]